VKDVSVLVPSYNRADLLRITLRSICAQSVPPLEIIVVDDGSTDHTPQVCAEFGEAIRVIRQNNSGLPAARNAGIQAAKGKWIAFCDSDDLWRQDKLEVQLRVLEATGADWSCSDFRVIDPHGHASDSSQEGFRHAFAVFQELSIASAADHFDRWLARRELDLGGHSIEIYYGDAFGMLFQGNVVLPSTSIVARSLIENVGLFDRSFRAEETEFFHRVAARGTVAIVMEPLVEYRIGHSSLINAAPDPFILDALKSIQLAAALRSELTAKERNALEDGRRRLRLRLAYSRLASLDRKGARRAVYDAWREGSSFSRRAAGIMLASLLPLAALRGLHWAKRVLRVGGPEPSIRPSDL
jgi:glycosyltransferase involved in cell wall biosynthesis